MGNYNNFESEFIERTIMLIDQYYDIVNGYHFDEQFNYTLMINCFLGLIIMPKEKILKLIPETRLTQQFKKEIGLELTEIGENIKNLRELIDELRHSIAHFDVNIRSENDRNNIDWIDFNNKKKNRLVAKFKSTELRPFLNYYSGVMLGKLHKKKKHMKTTEYLGPE